MVGFPHNSCAAIVPAYLQAGCCCRLQRLYLCDIDDHLFFSSSMHSICQHREYVSVEGETSSRHQLDFSVFDDTNKYYVQQKNLTLSHIVVNNQ